MLVSYKWLQDYVDIPWTPEELADRLTMAGLEVEGLKPLAPDLDGVLLAMWKKRYPTPRRIGSPFVPSMWVRRAVTHCLRST